uniref:ankyrin repeat domain-containing protein n=1 Tax=Agathobacter sp. TaxID=2021311 RepID=UPI00405778DA
MRKLFKMIRNGQIEEVKGILDRKPQSISSIAKAPPKKDHGQSPLMVAIKSDNVEVAHVLLDYGADIDFISHPTPYERHDIYGTIWQHAIGQCFLRAKGSQWDYKRERTEQYFELLCRLADMGIDFNRKMIIPDGIMENKNAWRYTLYQYWEYVNSGYGSYGLEEKQENQYLLEWTKRILEVLFSHGANIYDFDISVDAKHRNYDMVNNIIRNMTFNRKIYEHIKFDEPECPGWKGFEIMWLPLEGILRPYYAKDNPYYGAKVSAERKAFFERMAMVDSYFLM